MKIHELAAAAKLAAASDTLPDDFEYPEDSDEQENLTEALLQLENCWALLDALDEHFRSPRARMNKYLRREISRVTTDSCNILLQYNMAELHEEDLLSKIIESTSTSLTGEE